MMKHMRLVFAVLLTACLLPSHAHAAVRSMTLRQALTATGGYTIPAAWAGIWAYTDTTYDCTTLAVTNVSTGQDTLCAGQSFEPDTTGGFNYNCTGTVTDTQVNLTCSGSFSFGACTGNFTQVGRGTRTGDTAFYVSTFTTTWSPPNCAFQNDSCDQTNSHTTRIGAAPPGCTTPTRARTWGQVKTYYR